MLSLRLSNVRGEGVVGEGRYVVVVVIVVMPLIRWEGQKWKKVGRKWRLGGGRGRLIWGWFVCCKGSTLYLKVTL